MKVGVHEGSALSSFLISMDVSEDVRNGSLMELYVDDVALWGKSLDDIMEKYEIWKRVLEEKGSKA